MKFVYHRRTIHAAVALYAAVVLPGYGWHLVPGCGHHAHCHDSAHDESHSDSHSHGHCYHGHCHSEHVHEHGDRERTEGSLPAPKGLTADHQVTGSHSCGICQFFAQSQVQPVTLDGLNHSLQPEEQNSFSDPLLAGNFVASYSARAPPSPSEPE